LPLLTHTAAVEKYEGTTGRGEKLYAAPIFVKCRIQPKVTKQVTQTGEFVLTSAMIFFDGKEAALIAEEIPAGSRITLESAEYSLLSLEKAYGFREVHHLEGWLV
jgi:hypothetical protein